MRKVRLAAYVIVLTATAVWSQQAPAPTPDQPAPAPVVRDPHSTKADLAVPLCPATFDDSLETDGIAGKADKSVKPPTLTRQPEVEFTDEARRLKKQNQELRFEVDLSLVVDASGRPQNVCLTKSAGYGLDAEAANVVQNYRFKPATKDGKPVPKRISVDIDLHLN
jgi:TonB family protein